MTKKTPQFTFDTQELLHTAFESRDSKRNNTITELHRLFDKGIYRGPQTEEEFEEQDYKDSDYKKDRRYLFDLYQMSIDPKKVAIFNELQEYWDFIKYIFVLRGDLEYFENGAKNVMQHINAFDPQDQPKVLKFLSNEYTPRNILILVYRAIIENPNTSLSAKVEAGNALIDAQRRESSEKTQKELTEGNRPFIRTVIELLKQELNNLLQSDIKNTPKISAVCKYAKSLSRALPEEEERVINAFFNESEIFKVGSDWGKITKETQEQRIVDAEKRANDAELRVNDAEKRVADAERRADKMQKDAENQKELYENEHKKNMLLTGTLNAQKKTIDTLTQLIQKLQNAQANMKTGLLNSGKSVEAFQDAFKREIEKAGFTIDRNGQLIEKTR